MASKALTTVPQSEAPAPLTATERTRFEKLEQVIEHNAAVFVETGLALMEIRESRLYREQFPSFYEYCRARWGESENYVNRQIAAARVAEAVKDSVPMGTERVARELVPLLDQPKVLQRVAQKLAGVENLTAEVTREVVQAAIPDSAKKPKAPKSTPEEWQQVLIEGLRSARLAATELGLKKLAGQVNALLKEAARVARK